MRPLILLFQPRLALLSITLAAASAAATCMVAVRILYTAQLLYAFLEWNVALASLRVLHVRVRQATGWWAGWGFVAGAAGLAAFGVHLGRFVRLNSWDLVLSPLMVSQEVRRVLTNFALHPHHAVFPVMFAFFLFLAYAVVHAMSVLSRAQGMDTPDARANHHTGDRP